MTSSVTSVEIVEINYRLSNFLQFISSHKSYAKTNFTSRKTFFIGGQVLSSYSQLQPIKLATFLTRAWTAESTTWHLSFRVQDGSIVPSGCTLSGKLLELKTLSCENTIAGDEDWPKKIDFCASTVPEIQSHKIKLFDESDAETFVDKKDGFLKIYFKLKIKLDFPESKTASIIAGDVTELSNDFESLLKDSKAADVEIKVSLGRGQFFPCHRVVLATRSPIFHAMFESDMKETNEKVVQVDDILPKAMEHFISFLYCGRFQDSSWIQSLPQLAYASDKYRVNSLHKICDTGMIQCVNERNALALGKLAELHGLMKAAEQIRKFIAKNADDVTLDTEVDTTSSDENFEVNYSVL